MAKNRVWLLFWAIYSASEPKNPIEHPAPHPIPCTRVPPTAFLESSKGHVGHGCTGFTRIDVDRGSVSEGKIVCRARVQ